MRCSLLAAVMATVLSSSSAGAQTFEQALAAKYFDQATTIFERLYTEKGARWRVRVLLDLCGERAPKEELALTPLEIDRLKAAMIGGTDVDLSRVVLGVEMMHTGYLIGYADATRMAFHNGLSRDLTCASALELAHKMGLH